MFLFAGLVLLAPAMLLAAAVVGLGRHGPAGWGAAVLLLAAVTVLCRWTWRRGRSWWHSTKAPVTTTVRPHRLSGRSGRRVG